MVKQMNVVERQRENIMPLPTQSGGIGKIKIYCVSFFADSIKCHP